METREGRHVHYYYRNNIASNNNNYSNDYGPEVNLWHGTLSSISYMEGNAWDVLGPGTLTVSRLELYRYRLLLIIPILSGTDDSNSRY